jgi:hypothetical protein
VLIRKRENNMAEKRSGKKNKSKPLHDRISINILPDPKPDTPSYYINYAAVAHTEYDFLLSVLRAPAQLTPEQTELAKKGNPLLVEPTLQLIIPPRLIDGIIKALNIQKDKYEQTYGPIRHEK